MKLALILTGGTIGSTLQEDGWIAPDKKSAFDIIEKLKRQYPVKAAQIQFDCFMPYQILSENLNGVYLEKLIDQVQMCLKEGTYEGILICHGTDTLQYTAAILDYVFADCRIPVFLVSSNYPLEDTRANGLANFYYAIETISKEVQGVAVIYRNLDGRIYVHRGRRLLAHSAFEDDLYSIRQSHIGVYDENGNWTYIGEMEKKRTIHYNGLKMFTNDICWIRAYPGLVYPNLERETKAVILESYHSGTLGVDAALRKFAAKAEGLRIPVYLVGAVSDRAGYETMKEYKQMGIRVLPDEAPIAVYCRLWLELSGR